MELLEKTVNLRGSQVVNIESYRTLLWQRRIMALATLVAWIGVGLLIAALATPNWAEIEFINTEFQTVHVQLGVWGEWRRVTNGSGTIDEWIPHFPKLPENVLRLADADLKHYYRAQAAIGVLALIILLANNCLALYTFYHHRYMFKRLCACLYVVSAMAIYVTVEVLTKSVEEWNTAVVQATQKASWNFHMIMVIGSSTRMAQAVIGICVFAFFAFACGSHKQKGDQAATEDLEIEDRPVHIGRAI